MHLARVGGSGRQRQRRGVMSQRLVVGEDAAGVCAGQLVVGSRVAVVASQPQVMGACLDLLTSAARTLARSYSSRKKSVISACPGSTA